MSNEEIIKEFNQIWEEFEFGEGRGYPMTKDRVLRLFKAKDQEWQSKIRSLIPKIHGGGNARRLLESLLDNKSE